MSPRFQITPAVYLIFREKNKILLLRRFNTGWSDGLYSLPSGHLDGNETARQCAVREAKEEVGVVIRLKDLKFVHVVNRMADNKDHERVDFFFAVQKYQGTLKNAEPEKCDNLKWAPINKLPKNMVPDVKAVLSEINKNHYYSEYGY